MSYRFVALPLLAVLGADAAPIAALAAPDLPSKPPEVYALVYVGKGKNHKENAKKIAEQTARLRAFCNPKSADADRFHIQPVEGTAVLRIWYTAGTPREQAETINKVLRNYTSRTWRDIEGHERFIRMQMHRRKEAESEPNAAELVQKIDEETREAKERYDDRPQILEWAAVKDCP